MIPRTEAVPGGGTTPCGIGVMTRMCVAGKPAACDANAVVACDDTKTIIRRTLSKQL